MRDNELGKILPGYYADCLLIDGDPLDDVTILQDHDKINIIIMNGRVHKAGRREYVRDFGIVPIAGQDQNKHNIVPNMAAEDYPEIKKSMQKNY